MIETATKEVMKPSDPYLAQFARWIEPSAGQRPSWLYPLRKAGLARFAELGFPTLQHEDWRFTNVAPITKLPFKPVVEDRVDGVTTNSLKKFAFADLAGSRLVFVNGHFSKELSTLHPLPDGVQVGSLASALASEAPLLEKHLGGYAQADTNAFAALNTAFFSDGAFIFVSAGKSVAEPIQIVFVSTGRDAGMALHPRNLIIAERGAQLTVIENYVSLAETPYFTNSVTELVAGDGAAVEHLTLQDESCAAFHIGTLHGHFARACNVNVHSFALGA